MHAAVKLLVLVFAAMLVVTALSQPASAHYDPFAKARVRVRRPFEAKLKQLAAQNERLKKELEAAKERTRKAKEKLDELWQKLAHLRNAVVLRDKLHGVEQKKREKVCGVCDSSRKPEPGEGKRESAQVLSSEDKNADECSSVPQEPASDPKQSQPAARGRQSLLARILQSERVGRVRRLIEQVVLRYCPARPQSSSPEPEKEPASPKGGQKLETLRKRVKALKKTLEGTTTSDPAPEKVKSPEDGSNPPRAPQVLKKLKGQLLEQLRAKFRRELKKRLDVLKSEVRDNPAAPERRSAWF